MLEFYQTVLSYISVKSPYNHSYIVYKQSRKYPEQFD